MIDENKRLDLEKQGYRLVGNHSAIKVCLWTKKCLRDEDVCYKNTFFGIRTHRCVQMTPAMHVCTHRCLWCWRDIAHTNPEWTGPIDDPKDIIDGCIQAHVKYLEGFGGNKKVTPEKYEEARHPKHFAISLSGEPTFYPKLPELIKEIHRRGMTSFLVTNGTNPEMMEKLKEEPPTQLYFTFPAPNKEIYLKSCAPLIDDGWERIQKSLEILSDIKTRKVIRLTLVKDINMVNPEDYARMFSKIDADWLELKAYVWVGYSRERMNIENMPRHEEIMQFANEIIKHNPKLKILDEKKESRVVLLAEKDREDRVMEF